MDTKSSLLGFVRELGFDEVGICRPFPCTWEKYREWVAAGYHGEMGYLQNRLHERNDLETVLPGVQSVLVIAKVYQSEEPVRASSREGVLSRYAWGDDYHLIMRPGLDAICEWLQTHCAAEARGCVDTAPVLERDLAAQAGIGWVGKHTNLLSRSLGNWFFLGVVLTTAVLEPDEPTTRHCGTCTRCLSSCPTDAFVTPYVLDARRCISYLTIELKGPIPRELRTPMGNHVFGCDDCLDACPWNRFAIPVDDEAYRPRSGNNPVELIELMQLDDDGFRLRFRGSPVLRCKRRGLLRNVAVALGNSGEQKAVPVLVSALGDHEALIRGHVAWALGELGGDQARQALQNRLALESDSWVREEIREALHHSAP